MLLGMYVCTVYYYNCVKVFIFRVERWKFCIITAKTVYFVQLCDTNSSSWLNNIILTQT